MIVKSVGLVKVAWSDKTLNGTSLATDKSLIAVYNPNKAEAIFILEGASRATGTQSLVIPYNYSGDVLQVYIIFKS